MSDQFLGEIRLVGFNFAPYQWALTNGQILAISSNTALFALLGTFYGGNGTTTFQLPNLQGSIPISQGQGPGLSDYVVGETGGNASVTLLANEIPAHTHGVSADLSRSDVTDPTNAHFGQAPGSVYNNQATASVTMSPNAVSTAPGASSYPHNNMMPYLAMNWIIALAGIFPSRG